MVEDGGAVYLIAGQTMTMTMDFFGGGASLFLALLPPHRLYFIFIFIFIFICSFKSRPPHVVSVRLHQLHPSC